MKDIYIVIFLFLLVFVALDIILFFNLEKCKKKIRAQALELKMHHLYSGWGQELVDSIRKKQHDYNNHLWALTGMHQIISTYDELVAAQTAYCSSLKAKESHYYLLSNSHPMFGGFLYQKSVQAKTEKIELTYDVSLAFQKPKIPDYVLVYCMEILFDSIFYAVREKGRNQMNLSISESENKLFITMGYPSENPVSKNLFSSCSKDDFSSDTTGSRLTELKAFQTEYDFDIMVSKKEKDGQPWMFISLVV